MACFRNQQLIACALAIVISSTAAQSYPLPPLDMELDSWTDRGSTNVRKSNTGDDQATESYVRLDGNMLADSTDPSGVDGFHYMVFGSYQWGLYGCQVSTDLLTVKDGESVDIIYLEQYNPDIYSGNKPGM